MLETEHCIRVFWSFFEEIPFGTVSFWGHAAKPPPPSLVNWGGPQSFPPPLEATKQCSANEITAVRLYLWTSWTWLSIWIFSNLIGDHTFLQSWLKLLNCVVPNPCGPGRRLVHYLVVGMHTYFQEWEGTDQFHKILNYYFTEQDKNVCSASGSGNTIPLLYDLCWMLH